MSIGEPPKNESLDELPALLHRAAKLLIFTGAGISTNSGIPDFRGPQGVWKTRQPVYYDDFLASEEARVEYWDYKLEAWPAMRDARPNAVHRAIVDLDRAEKLLALVTQNIDGLHQMAGLPEERVVELHGTNRWIECLGCKRRSDPQPLFDEFSSTLRPPRCPECAGLLKPATISFGQSLNPVTLEAAERAANECDAVIALGSTLSVYPAAEFPLIAARRGVPYAIINRGPTDHDGLPGVTVRREGDVGVIFPEAVERALSDRSA
ncbi:MAG: Sir2 family NAD-dependent protein deacetylase [Terrimicrobiaceae bacterium]